MLNQLCAVILQHRPIHSPIPVAFSSGSIAIRAAHIRRTYTNKPRRAPIIVAQMTGTNIAPRAISSKFPDLACSEAPQISANDAPPIRPPTSITPKNIAQKINIVINEMLTTDTYLSENTANNLFIDGFSPRLARTTQKPSPTLRGVVTRTANRASPKGTNEVIVLPTPIISITAKHNQTSAQQLSLRICQPKDIELPKEQPLESWGVLSDMGRLSNLSWSCTQY